ncbi:MAG: hypothetical protein F4213_12470 [Boseongicola sp. SB0677_bin_26]|nr:hypothetical protein [Boseongicola sp. SB0665_bin_10]MYG26817.1 hypothetical protein [Boseongicola sp. SB0677_bin_26]
MPVPGSGASNWAVLAFASDADEAVIAGPLGKPGLAGTDFSGTGLRMVCQLPEVARNARQETSRSLQEARSDVRTGA